METAVAGSKVVTDVLLPSIGLLRSLRRLRRRGTPGIIFQFPAVTSRIVKQTHKTAAFVSVRSNREFRLLKFSLWTIKKKKKK